MKKIKLQGVKVAFDGGDMYPPVWIAVKLVKENAQSATYDVVRSKSYEVWTGGTYSTWVVPDDTIPDGYTRITSIDGWDSAMPLSAAALRHAIESLRDEALQDSIRRENEFFEAEAKAEHARFLKEADKEYQKLFGKQ